MCFERILQNLLSPVMHLKRLTTFKLLIESAIHSKKVTVTGLGQNLNLPIKERSGIRRSDRFIGNNLLQAELLPIYEKYISMAVGANEHPKIIVDWSQAPNTRNHILRASLATQNDAITLYEEVHPEAYLNSPKAEQPFLDTLKKLLPANCKPIIITDAGFHNKWFKKITQLGWDYVGRIRGTHKFFNGEAWESCKEMTAGAKIGLKYIGKGLLAKTNSISTYLYLIKNKPQGRKSTRRKPGGKRDELNHKRAGKEAWLIASSLPGGGFIKTKRLQKIYEKRMGIEQGFRHAKSHHFGFSLRNAYSRTPERIRVLLLIIMLATWITGLVGRYLEKHSKHLDFQCNSVKNRRILSLVYLGCRAIKRKISLPSLKTILKEIVI